MLNQNDMMPEQVRLLNDLRHKLEAEGYPVHAMSDEEVVATYTVRCRVALKKFGESLRPCLEQAIESIRGLGECAARTLAAHAAEAQLAAPKP